MTHPQPSLTGPRILLRPLLASDAAALVEAAAEGELWNLPFNEWPEVKKQLEARLRASEEPRP